MTHHTFTKTQYENVTSLSSGEYGDGSVRSTLDTLVSSKCFMFYPGDLFKHPLNALLGAMRAQNTARCEI